MTDPIEEAEALMEYWRSIGWDDDAPAMAKVRALIAAARADREALRVVSEERDMHEHAARTYRTSFAIAESKLARVVPTRDERAYIKACAAMARPCSRVGYDAAHATDAFLTRIEEETR